MFFSFYAFENKLYKMLVYDNNIIKNLDQSDYNLLIKELQTEINKNIKKYKNQIKNPTVYDCYYNIIEECYQIEVDFFFELGTKTKIIEIEYLLLQKIIRKLKIKKLNGNRR